MSCPLCHAANPRAARFCGQCYHVFAIASPTSPTAVVESVPPVMSGSVTQLGQTRSGSPAPPASRDATAGRFVTVDGQTRWTCAVCDSEHGLDVFVCDICGAKMDVEPGAAGVADADWENARRLEMKVPGLGHVRTGQEGMGYARLGVTLLWSIGVLVLLVFGGFSGLIVALPLLFGVVAVWGTGPGDVTAVRSGRSPRLDARRFMYVVIGVTTGLIVMGGVAAIL